MKNLTNTIEDAKQEFFNNCDQYSIEAGNDWKVKSLVSNLKYSLEQNINIFESGLLNESDLIDSETSISIHRDRFNNIYDLSFTINFWFKNDDKFNKIQITKIFGWKVKNHFRISNRIVKKISK